MSDSCTFPTFPRDCQSLLCRYLTRDVFEALNNKFTTNGFSLKQAINSGVVNPDSGIGVYAGDEESYTTFAALFDPIIDEYHDFNRQDCHVSNLNPDDLKVDNPDPANEFIVSTRIRVARNLAHLPLGPAVSNDQRELIERKVAAVLNSLSGELAGRYYALSDLTETQSIELIADHFLFKAGDRFLEAAGLNRDWPVGRGIYHNHDKTFLVWINEEDHLRIISMQAGGDIKQAFIRLSDAVNQIGQTLKFAFNDHLGFITSCPTNLGTAMRASMHIKLPRLATDMSRFKAIADLHELQIRGVHGEHTQSEDGVYDVSNRRRLGITEIEALQDLYDGVVALIAAEKRV